MKYNAWFVWTLGLVLVAAGLPACSEDPMAPAAPPLVEQVVGAAGGTIAVPSSAVRLVVPAGALTDDVNMTVSLASRSPNGGVGPSLELGPDGTQFLLPVEFQFDFTAADLGSAGLPDDLRVVTWEGGQWVEVQSVLLDASSARGTGQVRAMLEHFSTYAVARVDNADALLGTFGYASDDVFAFGTNLQGAGTISHWDGTIVQTVQTVAGGRFLDGWGSSPANQYALSYDGQGHVLAGDGTTWIEQSMHTEALTSIHGSGAETFAVGYAQTILFNAGAGWTDESYIPLLPGQARPVVLRGVAALGAGAAIAVGDDVLLERTGGGWQPVNLVGQGLFAGRFSLRSIWSRSANDVYVAGWEFFAGVGNRGVILHYDGVAWSREIVIDAPNLRGISGDASVVFAVGNNGTVLKKDGAWAAETALTNSTLYDVWCLDTDNISFVGSDGVFHYPGYVDPGGPGGPGGTGDCNGTPDVVLDYSGPGPIHQCGEVWTREGLDLVIQPQLPNQIQECAIPVQQNLCAPNDDYTEFGWTSMHFSTCVRVSVDLTSRGTPLSCVEIDVHDQCDDCTGGNDATTVAYLYDASGNVIDMQGVVSANADGASRQVLTLDGSSARAVRLDVCMTYGGIFGLSFWFD